MLDHIGISAGDIGRSSAFYEQALAPLGIKRLMVYGGTDDQPDHVGFGSESPFLFLGKGKPINGYLHIALTAPDRESVDAFYRAALAAGGTDNGLRAFGLSIIPATTPPSSSIRTAATWKPSICRSSD